MFHMQSTYLLKLTVRLRIQFVSVEKNPGFFKKTTHLVFFVFFCFLKRYNILFFF